MKGILKQKSNKDWVVITAATEYPLIRDFSNWVHYNPTDKLEVEFEIVELCCGLLKNAIKGNNLIDTCSLCSCGAIQYAKLIIKQGSFDKEGYAITRVIDDDNVEDLAMQATELLKNSEYLIPTQKKLMEEHFIRGYKAAQSRQEESSNWDDIAVRSRCNNMDRFLTYLKEHYLPPVKR